MFVQTLWRDWLTDEVLAELNLNERQKKAVLYLKINQQMTSADYQQVVDCPPRTATRDLNLLVSKGIIELLGKGRGAHYMLRRKRAQNTPNAPTEGVG